MKASDKLVVSGKPLPVDRMIGKGGEGEVYLVKGDPSIAVKIYTAGDRDDRAHKIAAMVRSDLAKRSPLAAFPIALVQYSDGTFAGFVMRLMGGCHPVHELYAPGSRKRHFPQADYRFLARSATNIARAFNSIHDAGCVVGDINHSGILVSDTATAALIDADSFQFTDGSHRFLCRVGVPEYTPPELQGKPLHGVVRTPDHDAFGLAVVIFQVLLMGRHPFVGVIRHGEMPPWEERIANFRYVYAESRDVGMDQPPGTPALSDFSPELAKLFDRAFSRNEVGRRPSSRDWIECLERFEGSLVRCADNPLHYGPRDASECAWCEMERQYGTFLFLPYLGPGPQPIQSTYPGRIGFDLNLTWARIERMRVPERGQLRPPLPHVLPSPSPSAVVAKTSKSDSKVGLGITLIAVAASLLFAAPKAWIFAIALALWGASSFKRGHSAAVDGASFERAFMDATTRFTREIDDWWRRIGLKDLEALQEQLKAAKQQYIDLDAEERRLVEQYRSQRRDRQLGIYLAMFDIAASGIKGIGPSKLATLSSFGIDTAADVIEARLRGVPGFGDALIGRLLQWRHGRESRFVYNASENDGDKQELLRIHSIVENKMAPLRAQLSNGAIELERRMRSVGDFAKREDPLLAQIHAQIEQARADLTYLGLPIPAVTSPPSSVHTRHVGQGIGVRHSGTTGPTMPVGPVGAPPSCPRCGSAMRSRLARRGRNAGGYFWGCSRYPRCKGTRPI